MSRWLQQLVPQYPEVTFFDVLAADSGVAQVDAATCNQWVSTNGLTHPVLRDPGGTNSFASTLAVETKDLVILDRNLKIVFKGRATDTFALSQLIPVLNGLK